MLEKQSVYQKLTSLRIRYNKVIGGFWFDICQEPKKYSAKTKKKTQKVLVVPKKVVPLHPLNRKRSCERTKRKSSLKDLHRQK